MSKKATREFKTIAGEVYRIIRPELDKILASFQQDMLAWQARMNMVFNTMNVFIRVLEQKGLVTEAEFIAAGEDLMREAQENVQIAKERGQTGELRKGGYIPSPMDIAAERLNALRKGEKDAGKQESSN